MSSTSNQNTSQSRLLALPAELQGKVINCLQFPEVHRLSSTCTHFRDTIYESFYGDSLMDLESDHIDATKNFYQTGALMAKGYSPRDIALMDWRAPCYTCLSLVDNVQFDRRGGKHRVRALRAFEEWKPTFTWQPPLLEVSRRCIACDMAAGLPNKDRPWLESARHLIGFCRECKLIEKTGLDIPHLQVHSQLCDLCFLNAKLWTGWDDKRAALDIHIRQLQEYAEWMHAGDESQDQGRFDAFENGPDQPEGMESVDWDWRHLRPDGFGDED